MIFRILFFVGLVIFLNNCASKSAIQFEVAKQVGSVKGYQSFLNDNPSSIYSGDALDGLELTVINKALQEKDETALDDFVQKYPNSPYIANVLRIREDIIIGKVFDQVKAENTLESYSNFIRKYEGHNLVRDAGKLYYKKYLEEEGPAIFTEDKSVVPGSTSSAVEDKQQEPNKRETASNSVSLALGSGLSYPLPSERIDDDTATIELNQAQVELKTQGDEVKPEQDSTIVPPTKKQEIPGQQVIESNPFFQNSAKDFSYLIDKSSISTKGSPETVLYGKVFRPTTSPRIVQPKFSFFVQTLQRTDSYVRIKTRFHNLNNKKGNFQFSHITLVSSSGRRVRPINIKGVNWSFSDGSLKSENLPNQVSELDFLFPSLNLFSSNQYKLYITLNNKNYLIQI